MDDLKYVETIMCEEYYKRTFKIMVTGQCV